MVLAKNFSFAFLSALALLLAGPSFAGMYDVSLLHAYADSNAYPSQGNVSLQLYLQPQDGLALPEGRLLAVLYNRNSEAIADYPLPAGMALGSGGILYTRLALPPLPDGFYQLRFYYSAGTFYEGGMPWLPNTDAGRVLFKVRDSPVKNRDVFSVAALPGKTSSFEISPQANQLLGPVPVTVAVTSETYSNLGFGQLVSNNTTTIQLSGALNYSSDLGEGQLARITLVSGSEERIAYLANPKVSQYIAALKLENVSLSREGMEFDVSAQAAGAGNVLIQPQSGFVKFGEPLAVSAQFLADGKTADAQQIVLNPATLLPNVEPAQIKASSSLGSDSISVLVSADGGNASTGLGTGTSETNVNIADVRITALKGERAIADETRKVFGTLAYGIGLQGVGLYEVNVTAPEGRVLSSATYNVKSVAAPEPGAPEGQDLLAIGILAILAIAAIVIYMWVKTYLPVKKN